MDAESAINNQSRERARKKREGRERAKEWESVPLIGVARATGGTCDWGYCDNYATTLRYSAEVGEWLPVCDECKSKP